MEKEYRNNLIDHTVRDPEENNYLTDEQLCDLMESVETGMYQAPEYLEQIILRKAEPEFVKESVEIVPIRHTIMEGKPILPKKEYVSRQFRSYTVKIAAAAAAIVLLLIAMPDPAELIQPKADISMEKRDTAMKSINEKTSDLCSMILEKTNQLFQKEEQ